MPDKQLYVLPIAREAQISSRSQVRRKVQALGALSGGASPVESLSLEPGERLLAGQYRGRYSEMMAKEMEELFDAPDVDSVPLFAPRSTIPEQGYYALENVEVSPVEPRAEGTPHRFEGRIRRAGTRKSHWRAVATKVAQIETPFGNAQSALVGIPASASKVRRMDPTTKATESASVHSTVATERGDVDRYDAQVSSYSDPTLLFELDYAEEYQFDPMVYDTRGFGSRTDADGTVHWAHVFRTDHEFEGAIVVDNGALRLTFDESASTLSVEEWDPGTSSWTDLALGSTAAANDWQVWDIDLTYIGQSRVRGQVVWEDTSDGSLFHLNVQLPRGYKQAQWFVPEGESPPAPSGLQDKLEPMAEGQDFSAGAVQTLVRREEVRK